MPIFLVIHLYPRPFERHAVTLQMPETVSSAADVDDAMSANRWFKKVIHRTAREVSPQNEPRADDDKSGTPVPCVGDLVYSKDSDFVPL